MKATWIRLAAFTAGIAVLVSCDTRLPTVTRATKSSNSVGTAPTVVIDTPLVGTLINVGDSVFVRVHVHDNLGVAGLTIGALTITGDKDLGTYLETPRYAPTSITFPAKLIDTTIRRYLKPISAADTTLDSLVVFAIGTSADSTRAADTTRVTVHLVSGPTVTITSPTSGDSVPAGVGVSITAHAAHPDGVGRVDIRVQGEATWPTPLDTTISQVYSGSPRAVDFTTIAKIPINAPVRSRVTITATATDVNRQPGSSPPFVVYVRNASAAEPLVTQTVSVRTEITDSVQIKATGEGIAAIGVVVRDSLGNLVKRDSVLLPAPLASNVQHGFALSLPITQQGKRVSITAFAVDQAGRIGYAVHSTQSSPAGTLADAVADSTLVVYGRTFALPPNRQGTVGDVSLDPVRGNVFLSNTNFNVLEVWQNFLHAFDATGVAVGSLPWGLATSTSPDTLLVANSGGTNISKVFVGSNSVPAIHEDPNRILTRNTYNFVVTQTLPTVSGVGVRLSGQGPISYSDRPQYIAQSAGGRIYYSTVPTASAPAGTIRWLDPKLPVPDPRQVWQYGTITAATTDSYVLLNVDSIVFFLSVDPTKSDLIQAWDHPYGQKSGVVTAIDSTVPGLVAKLSALGSDAESVLRLDVTTLALEDTTFVAASGNKKWIAFGEGNTKGNPGRVIMVADSTGPFPNFFSPVVTVTDLTDNASEQVFGVALDLSGHTVASHGLQSYFAEVDDPFHLRLQGKYDSFDNGAGIAFHPAADGTSSSPDTRLAFVGASSGVVEIVDIFHYISRGKLQLKNPIYGPLRVSGPMPGDAPEVILKIFALSTQGLIVIDLTAADIQPGS